MTGPEIHTLVGAYALDAVDDLERASFDRHLADCETCANEVGELRDAAARLTEGTWSVPPPRMREQVLARAAATAQLPPAGQRRRTSDPLTRWRRFAAAAAVVGVLGAGAAVTTYAVQEQQVRTQQAAAAAAQQQAARIESVLAAPDAELRADNLIGGGRVTVVMSDAMDAGVVVLADAPPPGPDRAYQLWMVEDGAPVSVGLLAAGQDQATELIEGVRGSEAFAVSLEPASGSRAPTTQPLVGIPLA
jgi:anti-sigma factor RsiW